VLVPESTERACAVPNGRLRSRAKEPSSDFIEIRFRMEI
jgi:hypothetical protein